MVHSVLHMASALRITAARMDVPADYKATSELDMTDILTQAFVVSSVNINQQNIADDHT